MRWQARRGVLAVLACLTLLWPTGGSNAAESVTSGPDVTTVPLSLSEPEGLTFDRQGNLYVADTGNNRVVELSSAGRLLHAWGTQGTQPGELDHPSGVAVDAQGTLYVADFNNRRLQKLDPAGNPLGLWNAGDPQFGCECRDAAVDSRGNLYVADESTIYLYRLSTVLAVTGKWDTGSSSLLAVRVDRRGDVWITTVGNQVKEYGPDGKLLAHWGRKGKRKGQFDEPDALALDGQGNVYVADARNDRVQKLSAGGKALLVLGRRGPKSARLSSPEGVAVAPNGKIYVADTYHDRIAVFGPRGALLAVWGGSGAGSAPVRPASVPPPAPAARA